MMRHHPRVPGNARECADPTIGEAPRVLMVGRPGAGKGTQGVRLAQRLGVQYLSTGDVLRAEVAVGSDLGRRVQDGVAAGELIPSTVILSIVESHLDGDGYVLDGFPRTVEQAVAVTSHDALVPHLAIDIAVSPTTALARIVERGRADDHAKTARRRLAVYEAETGPMLDYLAGHQLLGRIDGEQHPDVVADNVWQLLISKSESFDCAPRANEPAA
jgi:adenylate kinase